MKKVLLMVMCVVMFVAANPVKNGYEVGDVATDFKLKNVDGKMVSLANFKNAKGYVVIFDCNTCPYSKAYNQRIIDLNEKYSAKGFPVITINANEGSGDSYEEMVRVANKKKYKFPYLYDESQEVAKAFGATNTPHVYILTKDLKVSYIGAIDDSPKNAGGVTKRYVEDAIEALLKGTPVPVTKTKAIGCGIKWKRI